eukprot:GFUD01004011.1.p1 GENE.GFUD01004011.1~~GFUD01004011.1.p1  ORF type:complete len:477 (+),score=179.33 GFUD01004011.1:30-1460(+)
MNFSSPLSSNGGATWSSCGQLMATCSPPRLSVWDSTRLEVVAVFPCQEVTQVDKLLFSPDSQLVLVAGFKAGLVLIFSVEEQEWRGRVQCGAGGLAGVAWSGDSRHVLTLGEWGVVLTVWSLASKSVHYIKNPKMWSTASGTVLYNRDRAYSLVVERREGKDCLNIFSTDWQLVRHTVLDTEDCAGAAWSPYRDCVAVWDSSLYYRVQVYSLDGRCEFDYSAYEHQLGVKAVRWSPSGQFLAVASYDNKIRIFCTKFWTLIHEVEHSAALHEGDPVSCRAVVYQEEEVPLQDLDARLALELGGVYLQQSKYTALEERPVYLDFTKPDPRKSGTIKIGVGLVEWSGCGRYMGSRCDNLQTVVWVWDMENLKLAAMLVQKEGVKSLEWDPVLPRLGVVTGGGGLYLWTPLGAVVGRIPPVHRGEMEGVTELRWNSRGGAIAISNTKHTVLCKISDQRKREEEESDLDLEPSREDDSQS